LTSFLRREYNYPKGRSTVSLIDFIALLIVAGGVGAVGQAIAGYSRTGCLGSIALGFIGALVGMWLGRNLGLPELFVVRIGGTHFPVIWSIIGSALFVAVLSFLVRGRD
jgi:uncharacterized membrane protein YeaQ/YmgE (transglycosylase-associated protein family)